ncbi:MAG TPA: tetratricopeptide repeat protein [Anaeromyxobacter sp.]|nr:tetratricopeptide repeat protein [Anaeromyxobacter sp.]
MTRLSAAAVSGVVAVLALGSACATARRPAAVTPVDTAPAADLPPALAFPPEEVKVRPIDLELEGRNDEELFAIGTAAYGASEWARSAAAFARIADLFPSSRHEAAALFNAGLAYERLEEWRLALERFRTLERKYEGPDALEASFRVAECQYHLRELGDARATLDALARRADLAPGDRVRALAQRGIVELEDGRTEDAERSLRLALGTWGAATEEERLDDGFASQAQFYLGEVYREWFRALPLDPSKGDEERLRRDLEQKAEMLLSAQGHYLRAIRMGNDRWAVASGYRIGELYDELRAQLLDAPLPPGLDEEHATAYRTELRRQVRVLATKAITAYELTLQRAARSGVDDLRFLADAQASLDRLKQAIAADARPPGT